jgi:tetratricopeptide (TPR) repeat protein
MTTTSRLAWIAGIFVLPALVLAGPPAALAEKKAKDKPTQAAKSGKDDKASTKKSKKDKKKAEELHGQAVNFYKEGNYEEALKFFAMADELESNPVTAFNIARCYEKLGKYADAYDYYVKYIDSGDTARLEDAEEAMERIESEPVRLVIEFSPKGSEVFLDGDPIEADASPAEVKVKPGQHTIFIRKDGFESVERELEIPPGGEAYVEAELVKSKKQEGGGEGKNKKARLKKKIDLKPAFTIDLAAGATVSTSETVTSYIGANLGVAFRIKNFGVGIGLDNMFFSDSYLLAAFAAGSYNVNVWKKLSLNFTVGFGGAYLYSSEEALDADGNIVLESGNMWDLVVHADARLRYKVGPVMLQFIPLSADIFVGAGSIQPAPLAQFAFLVGVAYDIGG